MPLGKPFKVKNYELTPGFQADKLRFIPQGFAELLQQVEFHATTAVVSRRFNANSCVC